MWLGWFTVSGWCRFISNLIINLFNKGSYAISFLLGFINIIVIGFIKIYRPQKTTNIYALLLPLISGYWFTRCVVYQGELREKFMWCWKDEKTETLPANSNTKLYLITSRVVYSTDVVQWNNLMLIWFWIDSTPIPVCSPCQQITQSDLLRCSNRCVCVCVSTFLFIFLPLVLFLILHFSETRQLPLICWTSLLAREYVL